MIRGELTIRAPRAIVWSLLTDPTKTPEYAPTIAHVEVVSGVPGVVGTYVTRTHFRSARRPQLVTTEILESVVDTRLVSRGTVDFLAFGSEYVLAGRAPSGTFREEPEESTRLSWGGDYRLNGAAAWLLAVPLLGLPALQVGAARRAMPGVMQALAHAAERIAGR